MDCPACDDGSCLICQLRTPAEIGVSSSFSTEPVRYVLDDEQRAVRKTRAGDQGARDQGGASERCPVCRGLYMHLPGHVRRKHPEWKFNASGELVPR
jgi:hypothetical protein